jgi:hypothetical protein
MKCGVTKGTSKKKSGSRKVTAPQDNMAPFGWGLGILPCEEVRSMGVARFKVDGMVFPLPNDYEEFSWLIERSNLDRCFWDLRRRLLQHLKNRVPFIVEGQERIATVTVEVFICD